MFAYFCTIKAVKKKKKKVAMPLKKTHKNDGYRGKTSHLVYLVGWLPKDDVKTIQKGHKCRELLPESAASQSFMSAPAHFF